MVDHGIPPVPGTFEPKKPVERALHLKSYRQTPSFHHCTYGKEYVGNAYITRLVSIYVTKLLSEIGCCALASRDSSV
jgi:hypothetical protein